jgi:ribulose-5-phosphate 4-epimerase/fuculose-1-phosphate aldolase
MTTVVDARAEVASVARLVARAGLIEAFGHVSARLAHGGFAITSTDPLLDARADTVLELDDDANVLVGERCPLEAPLHAAVYAARADAGAICRTHSRYAAAWACRGQAPPLVHGLGGLGGAVQVYHAPQLICDRPAATLAAEALDGGDCLLLYANGALCVGEDLASATVRAWFLEERAMLASLAPDARPLSEAEVRERSDYFRREAARAWSWLEARFGDRADISSPITPSSRRTNT